MTASGRTIERTTCRACDRPLTTLVSFGEHFVSNFVADGEDEGERIPLELTRCVGCNLVQLRHTASPDNLYRNYWYKSGTNQSMRDALADIANKAEMLVGLEPGDTVLDIGCNDGTLLASYKTPGIYRVGFDPARNLSVLSRSVAEKVVVDFFGAEAYLADADLRNRRPKVVTSIAMFYDLEDPNTFVAAVRKVLDPRGVWVIQMSYLPLMLQENAFDNVCHEHLEYYSLGSLEHLLQRHGFAVVDVEVNDVNGGSFRVYVRNKDQALGSSVGVAGSVGEMHVEEAALGLHAADVYLAFVRRVEELKRRAVEYVRAEKAAGRSVYVYGASTKGNTLLQYYGLDGSVITAAAERNPDKWGKMTVGTHIPIISEEDARARRPDSFLVLPWHFIREFAERERPYLEDGGRLVLPLPEFRLVSAGGSW